MQNTREGFLGIFLEEWKMFADRAAKDAAAVEEKRDGNFDVPVKARELRIFADCDRPLAGLLYKQVDDSWIVVPVSEFSVPATEQEILIGKRVYQLWNSFTAPSVFVERSWVVDDIPTSDMQDLNVALLHVMVGDPISEDLVNCTGLPIASLEDPRLEYERKFVANVAENADVQKVKMRLVGPGLEEEEKNRIWEEYGLCDYALAAATADGCPSVPLVAKKKSWKGNYREVSGFEGFMVGDEPRPMKFYIEDKIDDALLENGVAKVEAYKKDTRQLVGTGQIMIEDGEQVAKVKIGNIESPVSVGDASEIVLVLV